MARQDCVVAVFANYAEARDTALALEAAGFGAEISVIGREDEGRLSAAGPIDHGDEMEKSAAIGAATGATLGLLASSCVAGDSRAGPGAVRRRSGQQHHRRHCGRAGRRHERLGNQGRPR